MDLPEMEASQFYNVSLRTGPKAAEKPYLEKNPKIKKEYYISVLPSLCRRPSPLSFPVLGMKTQDFSHARHTVSHRVHFQTTTLFSYAKAHKTMVFILLMIPTMSQQK